MNASISSALAFRDGAAQFDGALGSRRTGKVLVAANGGAHRIVNFLGTRGLAYVLVEQAQDVLGQLKTGGFDLVVSALGDPEGFELLRQVRLAMPGLPVIMIAGAELDAVHLDCAAGLKSGMSGENVSARLAGLTARERQVLNLIVAGRANKVIAYELSISPRTVENHRARVMEKLRVKSVAELVRLALGAEGFATGAPVGISALNDTAIRQRVTVTA